MRRADAPGRQSRRSPPVRQKWPPRPAAFRYARAMASIVISTVVYFIAAFFIKRQLVEMGIPKGVTRGSVIFVLAAAISYGAAYLVDRIVS